MKVITDQIIKTRLTSFDTLHKTPEARRALALALANNDPEVPNYDTYAQPRFQLSVLWARKPSMEDPLVSKAAKHLWRVLPVVSERPGEPVIIFHEGGLQALDTLGAEGSVKFTAGRLSDDPDTLAHEFRLRHVTSKTTGVPSQPFVIGRAAIPIVDGTRIEATGEFYQNEPTAWGTKDVVVYTGASYVGEDVGYAARSATVRTNEVLVGEAVRPFLDRLADVVLRDMRPLVDTLPLVA